MKSEAAIKRALREWILANAKTPPAELADDTDLIATRLLTSLQILDLVLYLEELREAPLDPAQLKPGAFQDLATIYRTFFEAGE